MEGTKLRGRKSSDNVTASVVQTDRYCNAFQASMILSDFTFLFKMKNFINSKFLLYKFFYIFSLQFVYLFSFFIYYIHIYIYILLFSAEHLLTINLVVHPYIEKKIYTDFYSLQICRNRRGTCVFCGNCNWRQPR